jgi:hypothetical protein
MGGARRSARAAWVLGAWLFSVTWSLALGASLPIHFVPRFNNAPLSFDTLTNVTTSRQRISVTRLDFLLSSFSLRQTNGTWLALTNSFAFISAREGRTSFDLENVPAASCDRVKFYVGLPPETNHRDPARYPAAHSLNPLVNGLHWGWQGGYVFMAIEGQWIADPALTLTRNPTLTRSEDPESKSRITSKSKNGDGQRGLLVPHCGRIAN